VGSTPYLGGGFGHFYKYAPTKIEYAIDRFAMEVKRQLDVLNKQLSGRAFLLGDSYSIADIAVFPWYGGLVLDWAYGASEFLSAHEYSEVNRWAKAIAERPAVRRGLRVNRSGANPPGLVKERHSASDLDI
jgi:GST-like protein